MSDPPTMLRHVVLFTFKPETSPEQRDEARDVLAAMKDQIPEVRALTVGHASVSGGDFDLVLVADFDDVESYRRYGPHDAHQHAWTQVVQPMVSGVKSVQFEYTP